MNDNTLMLLSGGPASEEAAFWFSKMNGSASLKDRVAYERWLALSPENAWAIAEIEFALRLLDDQQLEKPINDDDELVTQSLQHIMAGRHRRKMRKIRAASTSICLLLAIGGGWLWLTEPNMLQDLQADYIAERGASRTIILADGSVVDLDAGSAMKVSFDKKTRSVRLLRGQAFFEVAKDSKPFVVEAANGQSQVTGTSFAVSLEGDSVGVSLAQGGLLVSYRDNRQSRTLASGQSITYTSSGLGEIKPVETSAIGSWRRGRFTFADEKLKAVLKRLQRYRGGRFIIFDKKLAERRVTGSLSLADPEQMLTSLERSLGFKAIKIAPYLTIVRE